jgi:2-(3-amino-3-carboxypropyl)histidine synthase
MKTLFIEARSNLNVDELISKIDFNGKLGITTTIQHMHLLPSAKKKLKNSVIAGQVLGCDVSNALKIAKKVDAFLFIGSGNFHPVQIAIKTGKKVIRADPFTNSISEVTEEEIEDRKRKVRSGYAYFLNANKIGILVSAKPGQNKIKAAEFLKKELEKQGKKPYLFTFDTLDFHQLDNFPDIECWVNTACERMAIEDYDKFSKPVVNICDIKL